MTGEDKIAAWMEQIKFKRQLFGGVAEQDVWRKIRELNALYREYLTAERVRYDTLIAEHKNFPDIDQEVKIPETEKNGVPGE